MWLLDVPPQVAHYGAQAGFTLVGALAVGLGAFFGVKYKLNGVVEKQTSMDKKVDKLAGVPEKLATLESAQDRMRETIRDKRREDGEFKESIRNELGQIREGLAPIKLLCPLLRGEPCKGFSPGAERGGET